MRYPPQCSQTACMQSCVVFKVLTVVEVAADIVITWLAGAPVFRVFREHRGVHAVWLELETLPLNFVRNISNHSQCNVLSAIECRTLDKFKSCKRTSSYQVLSYMARHALHDNLIVTWSDDIDRTRLDCRAFRHGRACFRNTFRDAPV